MDTHERRRGRPRVSEFSEPTVQIACRLPKRLHDELMAESARLNVHLSVCIRRRLEVPSGAALSANAFMTALKDVRAALAAEAQVLEGTARRLAEQADRLL